MDNPEGEVIFQAFSVSRIYKFCSLVLPRSLGASPCRSAAASTAGSIISVARSLTYSLFCPVLLAGLVISKHYVDILPALKGGDSYSVQTGA